MPDSCNDKQIVPQVEHFTMMTLAGPIVTRIVDPVTHAMSNGEDERREAHDWLTHVFGTMTKSVTRWSELEERTQRLLARKDVWARVTALAYVLLERTAMPAADVVQIIESVPGVQMRTDRAANKRLRR
jgi:hypothetical protein